jgi:hypothetical protein
MSLPKQAPIPSQPSGHSASGGGAAITAELLAQARADTIAALQKLATRPEGLSQSDG